MTVGRILQIHPLEQPFRRGDEKSLFTFGGSAVVVFGERGRWRPSEDVLKNTRDGVERLSVSATQSATASGVSQRGEARKHATPA